MSDYDVQDRCRERYDDHVGEFERVIDEVQEAMDSAGQLLFAYYEHDAVVGMDDMVNLRNALRDAKLNLELLLSRCMSEGHNRGELWS